MPIDERAVMELMYDMRLMRLLEERRETVREFLQWQMRHTRGCPIGMALRGMSDQELKMTEHDIDSWLTPPPLPMGKTRLAPDAVDQARQVTRERLAEVAAKGLQSIKRGHMDRKAVEGMLRHVVDLYRPRKPA